MLTPGTRLGPYEIQILVGSGGMGEVYRARDTRLDRTVAIKILKPVLSEDPDFRQRFEREARTISQLNHPNICTLHDVGEAGAVSYLVMEYVEGETLAARLEHGDMPLDQALACGVQIADALDKAHRKGIIHGDLKPGNVMLTKAGAKLLDFGLARQLPSAPPEVSDSATRALPMSGTPVLGTLPYLAPEQLEDRRADERSDIFALGAVLYEVLTGRKAFAGDSYAAVVAAIMRADPPAMASLRPEVPQALDRAVATCLSKDPDERWQNAGDLTRELKWIASSGRLVRTADADIRRRVSGRVWAGVAALLAVALVGITAATYLRTGEVGDVYRTSILLPEGLLFPAAGPLGGVGRFAVSPDGRRIVFVASDPEGNLRLWIRPLDSLAATPLPGTDGAGSPFWSPDSRLVAFVAQGQLKTVDPAGGVPFAVTPAFNTTGSWNRDNLILFTPSPASPLHVIPAAGGTPRRVTELDTAAGDVLHRNAFFLPDGRHFVYVAVSTREGETTAARAVYVDALDDAEPGRLVLEAGSPAKFSADHLVYLRDNRLVAQGFDLDRLELTGEPIPITDQVELTGPTSTPFSVSDGGLLVYQPASGPGSQLIWFDREGRRLGTLGDAADYGDIDLSPDGRRAAVTVLNPALNTRDIWVFDVARGIRTRLTFDPADEVTPAWSADGTRIVFASNRAGHFDIYEKTATGVGPDTLVFQDEAEKYPTAWTRDGRFLLYWTFGSEGALVRLLDLNDKTSSRPLIGPPANPARLSPDGKWVAYYSNESGRSEVYVVSFPDGAEKLQLSNAGGTLPQWRGDGQEVFYPGRDNRLMAVGVEARNGDLEVTAPVALFEARAVGPRAFFDVLPDGQRFLVNSRRSDSPSSSITVLQNWARLPTP